MPSHEWLHLQDLPARQPLSLQNHLHGTSAIEVPRPLPLGPLSVPDRLLLVRGFNDLQLEWNISCFDLPLSSSTPKFRLLPATIRSSPKCPLTAASHPLSRLRGSVQDERQLGCSPWPRSARLLPKREAARSHIRETGPNFTGLQKCLLQLLRAAESSAMLLVLGSLVNSWRINVFSPGPPGWYLT